ncbi:CRAL-TRIO domain-containing protein [Multifurca ochricompacta]|uniref:CRAL-TRIO domain-containing protein n=1 Tax=Multifurca ochricompacta TaxID=376703 RepID=A0AAD4M599_9AGAM|nr:CRAL-TRIO domain-containing protein [Multifurca ochricompacta]
MATQASASALPPGVTDPNYSPPPGRLGNLTPSQQHALETIRKELQDEDVFVPERMDDAALLRFLRARKFDVPKAKAMLLSVEQWRKDDKIDELVKFVQIQAPPLSLCCDDCAETEPLSRTFEFVEKKEVNRYYPQFYHKIDKDGRPVYIERLGKLDIKALYAITSQERLLNRLICEYERSMRERLPASSRTVGHPVETFCTIMDLHNVGLSNFYRVKDYVMAASAIGQNRYPEVMGKFYIINAPWAFSAVWAIIKPWLDEVTVSKIDILGANYKEKLLAQIPAENLPKDFGGTCECPGGCSLSDAGPWKDNEDEKEREADTPVEAPAPA